MARVFHPAFNVIAKVTVFGAIFLVGGIIWVAASIQRSPWVTEAGVHRLQPVPFSHEHHIRGLGIDCRYCHTSVQDSSFAGLPATKVCMTCHSKIWTNAEMLEPVRHSWETGTPIPWKRVHNLPNFVYFNHEAHVNKGVGCSTCHGEVDRMPLMLQAGSLQMEWCLTCHREPERYLRPREKVFDMTWRSPPNQLRVGRELVERYHILPRQLMENCSLCHR